MPGRMEHDEGRPRGGPRCVRGWLVAAVILLVAAGCGARPALAPSPEAAPFARPLDIYRELGFLTGGSQFPVVASFATLAGPAASSYILFGLSMPSTALRFQRDGSSFVAEYDVNLDIMGLDSALVDRFSTRETIRVASFAETGRTDESILFQHAMAVAPGTYVISVQVADAHSSRGLRTADTLAVPVYGADANVVSAPLPAFEATGRSDRGLAPAIILNPRHSLPFGDGTPLIYVETYDSRQQVSIRLLDAGGTVVWSASEPVQVGGDVGFAAVAIPPDSLPLGRFTIQVIDAGRVAMQRPLLLTVSDQWMVENFDDVLQFLRYIAHPEELDSLSQGSPAQRRERWERFWDRRDPLPASPVNEFRDQFFQRVRFATEAFREAGNAGWQTDRGEVYIVLGPPDQAVERAIGRADLAGRPDATEWIYGNVAGGRLSLLFHDRTGFGRYELVPASASAFRAAAARLRPRP